MAVSALPLALLLSVTSVQPAQDEEGLLEALAPLSWLIGACWAGDVDENGTKDTHCYSATLKGTTVVDRHVIADEETFCGETRFHFAPPQETDENGNEQEGVILFRYYNIAGNVFDGYLRSKGRSLFYPEEVFEGERGEELRFQTRMTPINNQAYDVITQQKVGGVWREVRKTRYTKTRSASFPSPVGYSDCAR